MVKINFMEKKIYFIGIGGIGVSALAGYYLSRGFLVSGSDLNQSATTNALKKKGAIIFIGPHQAGNISKNIDLVIHTAAATKNNPELKKAKRIGIKTQLYAEALGDLTKQMFTIAVSGMHGKSTTTAMLALVLEKAGLDPTVIVGTKLREWNNMNYRVGKSKYLVIEADEYSASFLNYWPKIIVLTNIEEEHLDFYRDLKQIMETFEKYVLHLGKEGILVANSHDKNTMRIAKRAKCKTKNYSRESEVKNLNLKVPGKHNISNAMAVLAVAKQLKIPDKISIKVLNNFSGTWRRMEFRGKINGAKIYDDYGHHPTEIKATLEGAWELLWSRGSSERKFAQGIKRALSRANPRLFCIFQPHQYQRTYKLFNQFLTAFEAADKTIILPIYSVAGREKESIKKKVSSEKLVKAIKDGLRRAPLSGACSGSKILCPERSRRVLYIDSFQKARNYLKKNLKESDICLIMGAGDINKLTDILLKK